MSADYRLYCTIAADPGFLSNFLKTDDQVNHLGSLEIVNIVNKEGSFESFPEVLYSMKGEF